MTKKEKVSFVMEKLDELYPCWHRPWVEFLQRIGLRKL